MKTKLFRVILMSTLIMGISLCLLHGGVEKHWWKLDDTEGRIAKDSIGNINGNLIGSATFLPGGMGVHINKHEDSFVSFRPTICQFGEGDFSVYLEFKTNETLWLYDVVGNRSAIKWGNWFSIRMTGKNHQNPPEGTLTVELCGGTPGKRKNYFALSSKKRDLNDGKWHSFLVVRKGRYIYLYIDYVLDSKEKSYGIANMNSGNDFRLGRSLTLSYQSGLKFTPNEIYKNLIVVKEALTVDDIKKMLNKK